MKRVMIFLVFLVACAKTLPVQTPVEIAPEEKAPVEVPVIEEVPFPVIENCVDLDNADVFVKGRVVKGEKVLDDSCLSLKEGVSLSKVVEYVCENNEIVAKIFSCEYGCKEGACIKDVQKQFLVQNGECALGGNFKVTKCFDGCLPKTMCVPAPLKTKHYDFPYQLACLVSSDEVSSDVWFEFEVPYDMTVVLFAEV